MFKNLSIRLKLLSAIALFAVGFLAYLGMVWTKTAEHLQDSDYAGLVDLKDFDADLMPPPLYTVEAYVEGLLAARDAGDHVAVAKHVAAVRALEKEFDDRRTHWNEALQGQPLVGAFDGDVVHTAADLFAVLDNELLPACDRDDVKAIDAAVVRLRAAHDAHRAAIEVINKATDDAEHREIDHAAATVRARKLEMVGFGLVMIVVAAAIGFAIARGVARRIAATARILDQVADGDFRPRLTVDSGDEIGRMGTSLNTALGAVDRAFGGVRAAAAKMATAASTLAASSEEISSGAQEQAASLEETAASLEEITATVKQSAGNAQQASQLATGSRETAESGGQVVGEAVRAMNEVTQASRRIGDIITTIDEIALQTNLLALNAAVEAARAGEQGRGFAVVAAEVGNLAQRSATAAKEVKTLISDALTRVEAGHSLVGQSGRALSEIITSVKKVTDIFGEIAAAAREQSAGVDQVNEAVAQMDRVTQANSAQTAELSRTAEAMAHQAQQLDELLARFQISGAEGGREPGHERAAAAAPAERPASKRAPRRRGTHDDGQDRGETVAAGLERTGAIRTIVTPTHGDDDRFEVL